MPMPKGWRKHNDYDWEAFGLWIRRRRTDLGWTLESLGSKLNIDNKGTVSRIEKGRQGLSPDQRERFVKLLTDDLQQRDPRSNRRVFLVAAGLKLAGLELIPSFAKQSVPPATRQLTMRDRQERTILDEQIYDLGIGLIETWDACLIQGHAALVQQQATRRYRFITMSPYLGDRECALTAIRIGIRLARAQETVIDWFKRNAVAIATYNEIEEGIIVRYSDRLGRSHDIMREHAQLLALRGSLHREICEYRKAIGDLKKSIELAQALDDKLLQVDVICELAHLFLQHGNRTIWEQTLGQAREIARAAPEGQRKGLFALITYYVGAGQRRLAFDEVFDFPESEKIRLAASAIEHMRISRQQLGDDWSRHVVQGDLAGHPLITRVSEVQCQIWTEPERVAQDLEELKPLITSNFPALMGKLAITQPWPMVRMNWPAHNAVPFFDLSGKRDFEGKLRFR